jgi:hypothetical protein
MATARRSEVKEDQYGRVTGKQNLQLAHHDIEGGTLGRRGCHGVQHRWLHDPAGFPRPSPCGWAGGPFIAQTGSILASNGLIHQAMLDELRRLAA